MVLLAVNGEAPVLIVQAADAVSLALYRATTGLARRRPPLVLVHGTFSNRTFFLGARERGLGRSLAARGWDAWVPELRGHGRSGAEGRRRRWHFEDWIRLDAPAIVRAVLDATGQDRLVWVGHSAGGVIGFALAGLEHALSGAVAGIVAAGSPAPTGLGLLQYPMAAAGLSLTRVLGRFPARALGIGPEDEHPGIFGQWMWWNLRGRWHSDDGTDYYANARRIGVPLLGLAGGGDWLIAPPELCEDLLAATGSPDRTFVNCGRAEGFSEDFSHHRLIASTPARAEVWPLIGDWLEARFG